MILHILHYVHFATSSHTLTRICTHWTAVLLASCPHRNAALVTSWPNWTAASLVSWPNWTAASLVSWPNWTAASVPSSVHALRTAINGRKLVYIHRKNYTIRVVSNTLRVPMYKEEKQEMCKEIRK